MWVRVRQSVLYFAMCLINWILTPTIKCSLSSFVVLVCIRNESNFELSFTRQVSIWLYYYAALSPFNNNIIIITNTSKLCVFVATSSANFWLSISGELVCALPTYYISSHSFSLSLSLFTSLLASKNATEGNSSCAENLIKQIKLVLQQWSYQLCLA